MELINAKILNQSTFQTNFPLLFEKLILKDVNM